MNELKLYVDDMAAFEAKLRVLGGTMKEPVWIGNWYLETTSQKVVKVMQIENKFSILELKKLATGYAFVGEKPVDDIIPYHLNQVPEHNVLHKIMHSWAVQGQLVDVLVFDDIGVFACVNYEDGEKETSLAFIHNDLRLSSPRYLEVPFNVIKRRKRGLKDFDEAM